MILTLNENLVDRKLIEKNYKENFTKEELKLSLSDFKINELTYLQDIENTLKLSDSLADELNFLLNENKEKELSIAFASYLTSSNNSETSVSSFLTESEWNDIKTYFNVWIRNVHSYREAVSDFCGSVLNKIKEFSTWISEFTDPLADNLSFINDSGTGFEVVDGYLKIGELVFSIPYVLKTIIPNINKNISVLTLTIEKLKEHIDKKENINDVHREALQAHKILDDYPWYKRISISYAVLKSSLWDLSEKAKKLYSIAEQSKQEKIYLNYFRSGY
ncbi:hypothetical protein [Mycoplasmopsis pullorum]|uniref:hypothetical protein n=1 Tax=Mycoplasmopsis pullorum TaxID=48003 RepID=UPI001119F6D9|nr:hypothetical protein [Mycoplasmopsis pullorum]TNK84332.1 hypothetical protein C4M92_03585 [Mycoplasmopsis pullorum]